MSRLISLLLAASLVPLSGAAFSGTATAQDFDPPERIESNTSDGGSRQGRVDQSRSQMTVLMPGGLILAGLDRDANYKIDQTELTQGRDRIFKAIDRDKNKRLTLLEVESWRLEVLGAAEASPNSHYFDSNFDQKVTKDEFAQAFEDLFNQADRDEDGVVAFSELIRMVDRPSRRRGPDSSDRQNQERRGPPPGGGRGRR